ncbi:6-phosphogluconolactonase [Drechslerella dactyloides]|uniref:6-phosphogluconolactonase n=1 Tax=Drechslerella dactyloides TaxID=74499 RepID=A0AAD6J024_DREDA|nr:6-phosphogluconolactonase [Drechslerella dactyloides]
MPIISASPLTAVMFGSDLLKRLSLRSLALLRSGSAPSEMASRDIVPACGSANADDGNLLLSVGANGGSISILKFNPSTGTLVNASTFTEQNFMPSWQSVHPTRKDMIYSVDEGSPGGLASFRLDRNSATLKKISRSNGFNGTVNVAIKDNLLVVASYSGAVEAFETNDQGDISQPRDTFTYSLKQPGPVKDRQAGPHPHQAVIDPSGRFAVVPDLGADLLRLYGLNAPRIVELPAAPVPAGSGPRHGQFLELDLPTGRQTMFYLVNEIRNSVLVYTVGYPKDAPITFQQVQEIDTLPDLKTRNNTIPASAGEIAISNDKRFVYVSNRNDFTFKNRANGPSDSIALYEIEKQTGQLKFVKLMEAGGLLPRHFSLDPTNKFVAIALQTSDAVVMYRRNEATGEFIVPEFNETRVAIPDHPVCVQWL